VNPALNAAEEPAPGARAVVVGGGLAGSSAALELADRGWDVTLLETRPRLGGAAYSFRRDDLTIDTGQHVLLRCYTAYRSLLDRAGAAAQVPVQDRLDIPVLTRDGSVLHLRRTPGLPAPLHLLRALGGYSVLGLAERAAAARAMLALRRLDPDDPALDRQTLGSWLRAHGQGPRAVEVLWGLITVAALNIDVEHASLGLAVRVFRDGLLDDARAGDVAVPVVPLAELHDGAVRRLLERSGVRCRTGARVARVDHDPATRAFSVRTTDGETPADAVVVAVPHRQAARIVPEDACPDRAAWAGLGSSAIVNVHLHLDRRVLRMPFAAGLDADAPWLFDRTAAAGCRDGQYLAVSVSAADALLERTNADIASATTEALRRLLPAARDARVLRSFVTREPHATFEQRAGSGSLRPAAATRLPGLALAGAWTATGWPDTLEGAVRSGRTAAELIDAPGAGVRTRSERKVLTT
jgi:hydroxysqualene dehydroxylase